MASDVSIFKFLAFYIVNEWVSQLIYATANHEQYPEIELYTYYDM